MVLKIVFKHLSLWIKLNNSCKTLSTISGASKAIGNFHPLKHIIALGSPCLQSGRAFLGRKGRMWTLVFLYFSGWIKRKAHKKLAKENSKYIVAKNLDYFFVVALPAVLQDTWRHDLHCSLLSCTQGSEFGWCRKEVVALKPFAVTVSRKCSIKGVLQEFSLCLILLHSGFLCISSVLCSFSARLWSHSGGQDDELSGLG